jgi:hypothetical protein
MLIAPIREGDHRPCMARGPDPPAHWGAGGSWIEEGVTRPTLLEWAVSPIAYPEGPGKASTGKGIPATILRK